MQFSLKMVLGAVTFLGVFLALVRLADVPSASIFLFFVLWMLSPVIVSFVVLYLRVTGSPLVYRRRRNKVSTEYCEPQGSTAQQTDAET